MSDSKFTFRSSFQAAVEFELNLGSDDENETGLLPTYTSWLCVHRGGASPPK